MHKFPKIIWTFWNSEQLPISVDSCIKTWRTLNPDYKINIVNIDNVDKWIPKVDVNNLHHGAESYARLSDFIRLNILAKYGGIWLDASIICTQSFDYFFETVATKKTEFIGFYNNMFTSNQDYKVIESWAFACIKNSKFVKKWRDSFMRLEEYDDVDDWLDDVEEAGVDFQDIPEHDDPNYLAIHIAAQEVLQLEEYSQKNMVFIEADKTALKFILQRANHLSNEQRVNRLCKDYMKWSSTPIIKFIGSDRHVLDNNDRLRNCIFKHWKLYIATLLSGIE